MFECVEFESGGKDVEVKLWRCRAKLLKCLIFAPHFKLVYMLPPSKVILLFSVLEGHYICDMQFGTSEGGPRIIIF
jgi:hypothetical protein